MNNYSLPYIGDVMKLKVKICLLLMPMFLILSFGTKPVAIAAGYDNISQVIYIWRLINDVRHDPVKSLSALGIDIDAMRTHLGNDSFILDRTLPPLAFNFDLFDSAEAHNKDMINSGYLNYTGSGNATPLVFRILLSGYDAVKVGESIGALTFDTYKDPFDSAKIIFANMIKDELLADYPRNYRIFSDLYTEIGIAMRTGYFSFNNSAPKRAYVVTMDFGMPVQKRYYVIGNILKPGTGNGLFEPGNGVGGVKIVFTDVFKNIKQTAISTSQTGAFQFLKYSSTYLVLKTLNKDGSCSSVKSFWGVDKNEIQDLTIGNY